MDKNNYELILNKFPNLQYYDSSNFVSEIEKKTHIDVRKLLSNYNIIKPWDTNRACGLSNYFDISETKTNKNINKNSKLIITRPSKSSDKPTIYVYHNWDDKFSEIKQKILNKGYYDSFKTDSRKIKCWFEEENILRFGTKKTENIYIEFEKANLNSIIKQKYYFQDEETSNKLHLSYQGQLSALGVYFGFESKLARGDKNKTLYGVSLNTVAFLRMKDLDINKVFEGKTESQIDYIDVIWAKATGKIIAAFEVVLSNKDWVNILSKFQALKHSCYKYANDILFVIVGNNPNLDYLNIRDWIISSNFYNDFQYKQIKYLPIQNLVRMLELRDKLINNYSLAREFFNNGIMIDIN